MSRPFQLSDALQSDLKTRNLQLIRAVETDSFLDNANDVTLPSWPAFILNDGIANKYWSALNKEHRDFQFALIDEKSQKWMAVGNSIPVHFQGALETLPDTGWDWALKTGMESDKTPTLLCALSIQVLPEYRGRQLSTPMIQIMHEIGRHFGFAQLIAPVRPNKKSDYPLIPMNLYIEWLKEAKRFDPWIRVHEQLGARILNVCHESMLISATLEEWQSWTGMSFQSSGSYIIPGALAAISIDVDKNRGEYIEPNVWMLHN